MKFDKYDIFARVFPAVLTSIPFFNLHYFLLAPALGAFWGSLLDIKFVSNFSVASAFLFLEVHLSRIVSKEIFEKKMYNDGLNLPTTDFLQHLDTHFSHDYTLKIHKKIKLDFGINIPKPHLEVVDGENSRKIVVEAVSHIRTKVGQGKLTGQHNLEYGFVRNFSGGSIIACIVSAVSTYIFKFVYPNIIPFDISVTCFVIYAFFSLLGRKMISVSGTSYAKVLIQEYMTL